MDCHNFAIITSLSIIVTLISFSHVFGWHANLGISNQQAAQLYKTNPNDPQIIAWKNALQAKIDYIKEKCFEPVIVDKALIELRNRACNPIVELIYDNCVSHPGALLACLDPRIAQWVAKTNYTNSTNDLVNSTFVN